jgi:UDP:flavonoid glycosyltransferase YjiC (YdhE family)
MSKLEGDSAIAFYCGVAAKETELIFKSLPKMVETTGIEALIIDPIQFFVELAAMKLRIPYITEMIAKVESAGIRPNWEDPSSLFSDLPWITQCPREFDFESSHRPRQFHYAGLFHDGKGRPELNFPWDRLTGEPIVYASTGTIQNGNLDVFRTIAAAVAKKDAQLVISIGNVLRPEQIGPVPKNAILVNYAPQLELLKKASVCITHAGFNTVLEALTQGVPEVAIPITNEQPGVAARIAAHQTGVVSLEKQTVSHLSTLLDEVFNNPIYRDKFALDPEGYREEERALRGRGLAGAGLWTHS